MTSDEMWKDFCATYPFAYYLFLVARANPREPFPDYIKTIDEMLEHQMNNPERTTQEVLTAFRKARQNQQEGVRFAAMFKEMEKGTHFLIAKLQLWETPQ